MEKDRYEPKIKICGIRRIEDLEAIANGSVPDYIGFVFATSKRRLSVEEAKLISEIIRTRYTQIQLVGVFVNEKIEHIKQIVNKVKLDIVQLHGDEENSYIEQLKEQLPSIKIWKAVRVGERIDYQKIRELKSDQVLLDAYQEGAYGGTGKCISLDLLMEYEKNINRNYILAGGIQIEYVPSIAKKIVPYGLDISSGVEINGYKDSDKIKRIIKLIREEIKWEQKEGLGNSEGNTFQRL